jgi:hypothetical protein
LLISWGSFWFIDDGAGIEAQWFLVMRWDRDSVKGTVE